MLRSMFSGVSGLRSHQTMMDVVGNNISNVNTTGYKSSRATFQEALTQVMRGATAVNEAQGGVNPFQLGLGAKVGAVDASFAQGASQVTGRATDVAIQGDGFFVVDAGEGPRYTRAGAFSWDAPDDPDPAVGMSRLVGPAGERVLGWMVDGTGAFPAAPGAAVPIEINLASFADVAIGADGTVTGRALRADVPYPGVAVGDNVPIARIALATFANDNGLTRLGNSLFSVSANSGEANVGYATLDGRGSLQAATLEMSNVDLAAEFTNLIMAQRGFQANARTITTSDEMLQELVNLKR